MTDFTPLKDKVWAAASSGDRQAFDKACDELMTRGVDDMFRLGWMIRPKSIGDVYDLLDDVADWCHRKWREAMDRGDAPHEDVSPGEGPLYVKSMIKAALGGEGEGESETKEVSDGNEEKAGEEAGQEVR